MQSLTMIVNVCLELYKKRFLCGIIHSGTTFLLDDRWVLRVFILLPDCVYHLQNEDLQFRQSFAQTPMFDLWIIIDAPVSVRFTKKFRPKWSSVIFGVAWNMRRSAVISRSSLIPPSVRRRSDERLWKENCVKKWTKTAFTYPDRTNCRRCWLETQGVG